ncbi:glycosyltransferase family 1 protein [bacterium]|nr:glycosyltransferase family 1 protein [bacterium]
MYNRTTRNIRIHVQPQFLEGLRELGRRGLHVDIFTRRNYADDPTIDESLGENVRVISLTAGPIQTLPPEDQFEYLSEFTARLIAFSTRHSIHYDLVYSHYWLSGVVAAKLKEAWGIPFVQMFHTLGQMKQRILTHDHLPLPDRRITTETELMRKGRCPHRGHTRRAYAVGMAVSCQPPQNRDRAARNEP